jgi:hypothetical protein
MKRKVIFSVMLLALTSIIAMQSCKKESPVAVTPLLAAMPTTPVPATAAIITFTGANQAVNLTWAGTATNAIKWSVYFGTSSTPPLVSSNVTTNAYTAHIGTTGGKYYWQVTTLDANNIPSASPVWNFVVHSAPATPVLTTPANNATAVNSTTAALVWTCTDPEGFALTYDVYFGTTATPSVVASGISAATYAPTMAYGTVYYWKIVAHDPYGGVSTSAVNTFTTGAFVPNFAVFNGIFSELCPTISATRLIDVFLSTNTTTHVITMYLPIADAMFKAGWGNQYSGPHPIYVTYNPVTFAVTGAKQLLEDSFPDPIEQGPMYLTVVSGTINATAKTISIIWKIDPSTAEFGGSVTTSATTYTFRVGK